MLNSVAIMGRFAADPELKHTPSGVAVTSFTLAVDRNYTKPGEERQTDWIDVVAWRGTAEFICKYFTTGPDDRSHRLFANPHLGGQKRVQAQGGGAGGPTSFLLRGQGKGVR